MSRRELTKTVFRTVTRASNNGRSLGDVSSFPPTSSERGNTWHRNSSSAQSSSSTRGAPARSTTSSAPSNEKPLPSFSNPLVKANIDDWRETSENRLKANGFVNHRAKDRAAYEHRLKQGRGAEGQHSFPAATAAIQNYHAAENRATASYSAPDLASNHTSYISTPLDISNTQFSPPSSSNGSSSWQSSSNSSFPPSSSSSSSSAFPSASLHTSATRATASAAPLADDDEDFELDVSDEVVAATYKNELPPDVHVVNTLAEAHRIAARLASPALVDRIFACDTEVMDIDVKRHSPCCHGKVSCISIYCGPDLDFSVDVGAEPQPGAPFRTMLWVDTFLDGDESRQEEAKAIIEAFRPFFESPAHTKVWHNYSFDRHVMEQLGISMKGFDGDTMHMARLWDSSRTGGRGGYSLEALSCKFFLKKKIELKIFKYFSHFFFEFLNAADEYLMGPTSTTTTPNGGEESSIRGKISMKKLFGRRNVKKDGTEGKLTVLPPVHELQSSEDTKWLWIDYSAYDAKATWDLYQALKAQLRQMPAHLDPAVAAAYSRSATSITTLWDLYRAVWRPFGELLTNMEAAGMAVDRAHLAEAEKRAVKEKDEAKRRFRKWATLKVPGAQYMNVGSGPQVTQLLFGGVANSKSNKAGVPRERIFKVPNQLPPPEDSKKAPKKFMDITLYNVWGGKERDSPLTPEVYTPTGLPACSTPVLKTLAGKPGRVKKALAELGDVDAASTAGLEALREDVEDVEVWTTDDAEIAKLQAQRQEAIKDRDPAEMAKIAEEKGFGKLFQYFDNELEGLEACAAVDSLVDASAIETLLSNFIIPLQSDDISKPDASGVYRVHCSLNINTETGRLSARRPNLQNQPALEKDRYKVRKAFTADRSKGNTLIVADYGQLELRILAHMANCESMLTAFKLGGDFHSRTALGMYDHIQEAVKKGDCLLEWDGANEDGSWTAPPAPLLKDMFGSERRRAKVLNFSIAYGKTAHGLSKDWGVSLKEAEETVQRWYSDRAEVKEWQKEQRRSAQDNGYVCTILGRRRQLPDARSSNRAAQGHALRAAINTPIQGSAADVATAAMLRIVADKRLQEMGWTLLLQVHDEVILEGPNETAALAQAVVVECMRSPFGDAGGDPLRVELLVDSKYAPTWYDAK